MTSTTLATLALTNLIRPLVADLYKGAKEKVQANLLNWSTDAGIANLATTLADINKAKTIWSGEDETPLDQFYYPSKIRSNNKIIKIDTLQDMPDGNLVVEGIVGQGKSIFMRHLAASTIAASPPSKIPLLIELRTITPKRSLLNAISLYFDSIGITYTEETLDYLALSGKIVLLLDGFDEIPAECLSEILFELSIIIRKYPQLKIIISSRPRSHIQNSSGFKVINLVPLSEKDYDPFVSKLITSTPKRFDVISALHECRDGIKGIINTPLMLTLVVMIYQTEKEIPSSLPGFFDKLFGVVFTRHDKLKAGFNRQHYSGLPESRLKRIFEAFCFMLVQRGVGRSMSTTVFNKAFSDAKKFTKEQTCENENFRKDIVKVSCLMLDEGLDTTTFLHKSILDYHAAAFIRDLSDTQSKKIYSSAIEKFEQWEHVLHFLKEIDPLRYAKQYTMIYLPDITKQISSIIERKNTSELITFLENIMPDGEITISQQGECRFTRLRHIENELCTEIQNIFPQAIFKQCKIPLLRESPGAENTNSNDPLISRDKYILTIRSAITKFGDDAIWEMLKTIEESAIRTLKIAAICINNEIVEHNLLDEILSKEEE